MATYRCDDWSQLVGSKVEIRRHRQSIRAGVVADVMPDSSMLWLAADQNELRTIYEAAEGYEIWADPVDMPDAVYLKVICNRPHVPLVGDSDSQELWVARESAPTEPRDE